jgi:hypothetical protein
MSSPSKTLGADRSAGLSLDRRWLLCAGGDRSGLPVIGIARRVLGCAPPPGFPWRTLEPPETCVISAGVRILVNSPASRRNVMTSNSSRPIARVFQVTAAPGCRDELLRRFHSSSAALVNSKSGCLGHRILAPPDPSAHEVVVEPIRQDPGRGQGAFGDAWQESYLPEVTPHS